MGDTRTTLRRILHDKIGTYRIETKHKLTEADMKALSLRKDNCMVCSVLERLYYPSFSKYGATVTVNKERYVDVLDKFWIDLQREYPGYVKRCWFQQDGVIPHTDIITREWLKKHFNNRVVS